MNIQGKYIKYEDYVALEERCAALSADNDKAMEAMKQANEAVKLAHSKYSKLASENAALRSALNNILQPDAAVLERNHRVRALDAMETPATDAFLDEVRTQARNELITELESRFNQMTETLPVELRSGAAGAAAFVSAFRKGAAL